jgi:hypothetical protein
MIAPVHLDISRADFLQAVETHFGTLSREYDISRPNADKLTGVLDQLQLRTPAEILSAHVIERVLSGPYPGSARSFLLRLPEDHALHPLAGWIGYLGSHRPDREDVRKALKPLRRVVNELSMIGEYQAHQILSGFFDNEHPIKEKFAPVPLTHRSEAAVQQRASDGTIVMTEFFNILGYVSPCLNEPKMLSRTLAEIMLREHATREQIVAGQLLIGILTYRKKFNFYRLWSSYRAKRDHRSADEMLRLSALNYLEKSYNGFYGQQANRDELSSLLDPIRRETLMDTTEVLGLFGIDPGPEK